MIITTTEFLLKEPITLEQARSTFLGTAPTYRNVPGLLRKHYVLSEDGRRAGGIYLWNSKEEALALYSAQWHSFVKGKYGCDAVVTFLDSPVFVDNEAERIVSD
jgi:hypothetical protein